MKADTDWVVSELRMLEQVVHRARAKRDEQPAPLRSQLDRVPRELDLLRAAETLASNASETYESFARLVEVLLAHFGEVPLSADEFVDPLDVPPVRRNGGGLADVVELPASPRSLRSASL